MELILLTPPANKDKAKFPDDTVPEQEQAPAMSLTNRYASVQNVLAQYILSQIPVVASFNELGHSCSCGKTAATLNEIISKHQHKKDPISVLESRGVQVNWKRTNNSENIKKGFVTFTARSADSDEAHTVYFQFLKDDDEDVTNPDAVKSYADIPVTMACTCESFLFYGDQWYALQNMYLYMPALRRSILPPVSENRISRVQRGKGLNFRVCKHILACYDVIKQWQVKTVFKTFMKYTPLSRIVNPQQWKQSFGMDFTYNNIRDYLKHPSPIPLPIRNFFRYKKESPEEREALGAMNEYFKEKWTKKSTSDKFNVLKAYINHPEEIFYFLMREAIDKHGNIQDRLAKEGIILISKTIDPNYARVLIKGDLDAVPESVPVEESEDMGAPKGKEKGMPLVKPVEEDEELPGKKKTKKEPLPSSKRFETKKTEKSEKGKGRFEENVKHVPKGVKPVKSPLIK